MSEKPNPTNDSWRARMIAQMLALPRITRLLITTVFAVSATLAVSPLIDEVYLQAFFSEDTIIVPSLIAGSIGVLMYAAGYYFIVGLAGEKPKQHPFAIWYILIGWFSIGLVIVWVLRLILLSGS